MTVKKKYDGGSGCISEDDYETLRERMSAYISAAGAGEKSLTAIKKEGIKERLAASSQEFEGHEIIARESLSKMSEYWRVFGSSVVNFWTSFWADIAKGDGMSNLLKNFLNMLAQMAVQLGTLIALAGIAMQTVPIFGNISGAAAIAAGAALTAFGGVLRGLSSAYGASGSGALGAPGSSSGGWAGTNPASSQTAVYNITIAGGFSTAEDIAKELEKIIRRGKEMGYSYV